MKFCCYCGETVVFRVPENDDRERYVCDSCDSIHYQNPKVVAGCLPVWQEQVLLCRRAIEPRCNYWTLPAGFMELGETSTEAAMRETIEEANARVDIHNLYVLLNLPHVNQVYMMFRSSMLDLDFGPSPESREVKLFNENEIPWNEIAFTTISYTLKFYFEDRKRGNYPLHIGDIIKNGSKFTFRSGPLAG